MILAALCNMRFALQGTYGKHQNQLIINTLKIDVRQYFQSLPYAWDSYKQI